MSNKRRLRSHMVSGSFVIGMAMTAVSLPPVAFAQNSAPSTEPAAMPELATDQRPANKKIDEVIVTAQKREQALFDVPLAVSAFSGQQLEDMGADSLTDIALSTPGFSVTESGPGVQTLQIRGISPAFGEATVGYLLDNITLTSFSSSQPDAATFDLASVEILRGPQGTLYGEGSMGGTVKLRTNKPLMGQWELIAQGGGFHTELGDPSYEANAAVNVPVTENSAARIVVGYADIGGFIDQKKLDRPNDNFNEKLNGRIRYLWDVTESIDVNILALGQKIEAGSANAADENYNQFDGSDIGIDDDSTAFSVDLNWDMGWSTLLFTNSYFTRDLEARFDGREGTVGSVTIFNATGIDLGPLDQTLSPILQDILDQGVEAVPLILGTNTDTVVSEARLQGSWDDRLYWTAGVYLQDQEETVRIAGDIITSVGLAVTVADTYRTSESLAYSVFGQAEYDFFPWMNLAIGGRYFVEDMTIIVEGEVNTQSANSNDDLRYEAFTPRVSLSFRGPENAFGFVDQSLLYMSYSRGFRSGGANTRTEGSGVSPTYDPDFIDNYEVGGKVIFFDNLLSVELAYYYYEWTDVQVIDQEEGAQLTSIANTGSTEANGIDWSVTLSPLPGLSLIYAGALIDTDYVTNSASKQKGDPVDFVPELQYSAAASYHTNVTDLIGLMGRVDYTYQDRSVQTNRSSGINREGDDVEMLNARLGIELPRWQLYLYGRNLLNRSGAMAPSLEERQPRPRPRQVGVQFNISLN